jgi:hypothetical protein
MQPPNNPNSSLQDSVVGGNLHTGNVIHNHYHINQPAEGSAQTVQPQSVQPQPLQQTYQQRPSQGLYPHPQPMSVDTYGDEAIVAYLIWFFLGIFGGHRFYFGHYGLGVLYFFTGGFFLIGWIIDLFLIPEFLRAANQRS